MIRFACSGGGWGGQRGGAGGGRGALGPSLLLRDPGAGPFCHRTTAAEVAADPGSPSRVAASQAPGAAADAPLSSPRPPQGCLGVLFYRRRGPRGPVPGVLLLGRLRPPVSSPKQCPASAAPWTLQPRAACGRQQLGKQHQPRRRRRGREGGQDDRGEQQRDQHQLGQYLEVLRRSGKAKITSWLPL